MEKINLKEGFKITNHYKAWQIVLAFLFFPVWWGIFLTWLTLYWYKVLRHGHSKETNKEIHSEETNK